MKINKIGGKTIIIAGDNDSSGLNEISDRAQKHLQKERQKLPKEELVILDAEEALKDMPADAPYTSWKGGWTFATIKNGELQDFLPDIVTIIQSFYSRVTAYLGQKNEGTLTVQVLDKIEERKALVMDAILEEMRAFQMYSLKKRYSNGQGGYDEYDASPLTQVELTWGNKTYISHIFKPELDMNVIEGVGGSYGGGESTHNVRISKDVFKGVSEHKKQNSDYLANMIGYRTSKELLDALRNNTLNEEGKRLAFLGNNIRRTSEDTN